MIGSASAVNASVRPSVRPSVRAYVRACILLAGHITNQRTELHQTLVDRVLRAQINLKVDELTSRSQRNQTFE